MAKILETLKDSLRPKQDDAGVVRLASMVMEQANARPVTSIDQIVIPAEMREPASNTVGAWMRVAFWLMVSYRVRAGVLVEYSPLTYARQFISQTGPTAMLAKKSMAALFVGLTAAGMGAARYLGVGFAYDIGALAAGWLVGREASTIRSDDPDLVREVYRWGIDVAGEVQARRALVELQALAAKPVPKDRNLPWYVTVGGVVVGGSLVLWLTRPYIQTLRDVAPRRRNPRRRRRRRRR